MAEVRIDELLGLPAQVVDQPHSFRIGSGRAIGIEGAIDEQERSIGEALGMGLGGIFSAPVVAPGAGLGLSAPFICLVKAGAAYNGNQRYESAVFGEDHLRNHATHGSAGYLRVARGKRRAMS